ncbi:MAG: alpha/beta fold hydrolase [Caldilineaceae bacterium]|nr:alpha/beta fold hydrolase [Caldilineaceae bacterium]
MWSLDAHRRHHRQIAKGGVSQTAPSPGLSHHVIQRAHNSQLTADDVQTLQGTIGNQAVQRLLAQKKDSQLAVGPENDPQERQAQQIATQIAPSAAAPSVQRAAPHNHGDNHAGGPEGGPVDRQTANAIQRAQGRGQPLDPTVRSHMEQNFGVDFSKVRVHTNGESDQLNRILDARAFTTGQDIFFQRNAYRPHSGSGTQLLAHELTHVVQQTGGAGGQVQRKTAAGLVQRAKGYSHIPGAGDARDAVFGTPSDRREQPGDLSANFLDEVKLTPVTIRNVKKRFLRQDKVYLLKGFLYEPKKVAYNGTTVLALSGSGGSSENYMRPLAERYVRMGCRVVAVNYRGFGDSSKEGAPNNDRGTPTEKGLYSDAMSIYQALVSGNDGLPATPANEILIHGYSLGGPIAATLAKRVSKQNRNNPAGSPKGLVLDRAMTSTYKAAKSEVAAPMAFGAKMAVGSLSTKNKLKGIRKHNPNLPIVFTSASSTAGHGGDLDVDMNLSNPEEQNTLTSIYRNNAQSDNVTKLQDSINSLTKSKDALAGGDVALAGWAQQHNMDSSHVSVSDSTHFSHDKIMNALAPELFNRGLINDQSNGDWQNPSNLKRTRARDVQEAINRSSTMQAALSSMQNLQVRLNVAVANQIVDASFKALKADAIAHQAAVNQLLQVGTKDSFFAACDLADTLKAQLKNDAVGRLTTNAELIAHRFFVATHPFAMMHELMTWINALGNTPDAQTLRQIHAILTFLVNRYG